ncbi:cytochrome P450, partial [Baffinella frigidus]
VLRTSAFASLTFRVASSDVLLALDRGLDAAVLIPRGAGVVMSPAQLGADPSLWPDAGAFRPERFLAARSGDAHDRFSFLPFGAGPHTCLGARLAMVQVTLVVSAIVRAPSPLNTP